MRVVASILPKDILVNVHQQTPGNLDPEECAILRRVIDLIQQNAKGAGLGLCLRPSRPRYGPTGD